MDKTMCECSRLSCVTFRICWSFNFGFGFGFGFGSCFEFFENCFCENECVSSLFDLKFEFVFVFVPNWRAVFVCVCASNDRMPLLRDTALFDVRNFAHFLFLVAPKILRIIQPKKRSQ